MATVLIGGLLTSTLLTLVFAPVVYSLVDDLASLLVKRGWAKPRTAAAAAAFEAAFNGASTNGAPAIAFDAAGVALSPTVADAAVAMPAFGEEPRPGPTQPER